MLDIPIQAHRCAASLLILGVVVSMACGDEPDRSVVSERATAPAHVEEGVEGRITDTEGRPVEGALIQPSSLDDPRQPIPEIAILSDATGKYQWPLFPGHYEILASAEAFQAKTKPVTVQARQVTRLDFVLQPEK